MIVGFVFLIIYHPVSILDVTVSLELFYWSFFLPSPYLARCFFLIPEIYSSFVCSGYACIYQNPFSLKA